MFNDILVPLDGSELSERALPMAQGLAKSSEATVHLIQMVSREHELVAGRGTESAQTEQSALPSGPWEPCFIARHFQLPFGLRCAE